ncbi:unnamed protein product [Dracunculus medinensis]|uniref:Uncharacterized protein n=1 Tax=Dracunculus medinensis TaxID=318479 RepID=A0A0N4U5C1_DRAME|nr:unnamed protein product [Dracunculus medinensis]
MEEEERKERKKRERAQEALRKADRIRAAHEELAGERRAARMKSHTSSSFESCDRLEWWEKKQPKSDNRFSSPVIPALRDRRDSNSSQRINNNEQIGLNFDSMNINSRPSSKLSDKSYEGPRKSNRKSNGDLKSLQPMSLQNKQRAKSGDNRNRLTNSDAGGYDSTFGNELEREAIKSRGFTVPKKP